jgi:hypothetical protein
VATGYCGGQCRAGCGFGYETSLDKTQLTVQCSPKISISSHLILSKKTSLTNVSRKCTYVTKPKNAVLRYPYPQKHTGE